MQATSFFGTMQAVRPNPAKLGYRADLQGLRAIAVVMVLLFHFELLGATGGFAGVDVFFVLSGFLMTSILRGSSRHGPVELLKSFVIRRVWRLAPALLATIAVTLAAACIIMVPYDLEKLGRSAIFAGLFASNYHFLDEAGYFAQASIFKPLLHTWSLAVEMQFYILWALGFLLFRRFSDAIQFAVLLTVVVLTYIACHVWGLRQADEVFFSTPYRIWQFGLGAMLANPWFVSRLKVAAIAWTPVQIAALAALAGTTFLATAETPWPFGWGVVPTVAAAIIIAGNLENRFEDTAIARLLSMPPMLLIGEISYSLYLVHWPIMTLTAAYLWPDLPLYARIAGFLCSFPAGYLMWRFVERPTRTGAKNGTPTKWRLTLTAGLLAVVAAGFVVSRTGGLPERFGDEIAAKFPAVSKEQNAPCADNECPKAAAEPTVYLWGDSHAGHFIQATQWGVKRAGLQLRVISNGGCFPSLDLGLVRNNHIPQKCETMNDAMRAVIGGDGRIDIIVLAARWQAYYDSFGFGEDARFRFFLSDGSGGSRTAETNRKLMRESLDRLARVASERNAQLLLLGQVPNLPQTPNRCVQYAAIRGEDTTKCAVTRAIADATIDGPAALLRDVAERHENVTYVDTRDAACDGAVCPPIRDRILLYRDDDHLTPAGSLFVAERLQLDRIIADLIRK